MAEDAATLEAQLAELRAARARGVRKVQYSDGRAHEYGSLDELGRVITDLERRLAALTRAPVRTVLIHSSKGV
ncbi:hypothetical protein [Xanthobacter sp. KR7-225]|uniref:phage head-tail joining protein n=1 Tax=Xanthobacter sp. KR7-225 TaxID=3156613 RepID=UPI0032B4B053